MELDDTHERIDAEADLEPGPSSSRVEPIRAGDVVGRYIIVDRLGAGGMGTVFSAYDRELDRKVALKVLQAEVVDEPGSQQRLLREAQAMAKLDHPNVVSVFDVGTHEGRVFVAMEFVRGSTLRVWQDKDRRWSEVVEAYQQAARGLSAAHGAGLVHRDFKPDNAMVDNSGRVRVMDFGLVRATGSLVTEVPIVNERKILEPGAEAEAEAAVDAMDRIRARMANMGKLSAGTSTIAVTEADAATRPPNEAPASSGTPLAHALTRAGTVMGTPAYMSPEQIRGESADARSDQFSFCIALYEALYGERPFGSDSVMKVLDAMETGKLVEPPADTEVPVALRRVLERGLAAEPDERWGTVAELDEAVSGAVRPRPLRLAWPVGITFGTVVAAAVWAQTQREPPCRGGPAFAAEAWGPERSSAVSEAFAATELSFAADSAERTIAQLDGYVRDWVEMHRETCEATEIRREQSASMLDRRMACLSRRLRAVDALASVLVRADADAVESASEAARRLPPVDGCADAQALLDAIPPPKDAAVSAKVEELDDRLASVRAEVSTGHYSDAVEIAQAVVDEAGETGYGPIVARANLELGRALDYDGKHDAAQVALRKAALEGRAASEDGVAADAEALLVFVSGVRRQRFDRGRWWADHAEAAVRRADRPEAMMALDNNLGSLLMAARQSDLGLEHLQRALAQRREAFGVEHPDTLESLLNVGVALRAVGRFDESKTHLDELVALREEMLGSGHPHVADARGARAATLIARREWAAAGAELDAVVELQERAYGRSHPSLVPTLLNRGYVALERKDFDAAHRTLNEAAALADRLYGGEHPKTLSVRFTLARVHGERGELDEALVILREIMPVQIAQLGEQHPAVGRTRDVLAEYEAKSKG